MALWPGSSPHFLQAISDPRWEGELCCDQRLGSLINVADYEWEYLNADCRFSYMGDGYTDLERAQGDNTWYLDVSVLSSFTITLLISMVRRPMHMVLSGVLVSSAASSILSLCICDLPYSFVP